ncbi:hypothetical protein [Roseovarius sp. E0-M6]|uniref:hypothetical protein n=1 Tax=Roseovarius sp. E0-M6 TaxID=3127118 RepID=UPI00300FCAC7
MKWMGVMILAVTLMAGPGRATAEMSDIKRLEASRMVYLEGLAQLDPYLVLAASKIRAPVRMMRADRAPQEGSAAQAGPISAAAMLGVALDMAQGDPVAEAAVKAARATMDQAVPKGLQGGPAFNSAAIAAKGKDRYPGLTFKGGRFAEIYIEGHGGANLDLFVYDGKGRLVCSDTDISDFAHCGWYPQSTETYTVQVTNKGNGTQYSLVTN